MNNIELIKKYPFLEINEGYTELTWFNFIPEGWRNAFGIELCDELLGALGEHVNEFEILEIKEKFGRLRIYYGCYSDDARDAFEAADAVINKYEGVSYNTCIWCGNPATRKQAGGYSLPCCDKHFW